MNYENFDTAILEKYSLKLIGSNALEPLQQLLTALPSQNGSCKFKQLPRTELDGHQAAVQAGIAAGTKSAPKPRKERSDKDKQRGPRKTNRKGKGELLRDHCWRMAETLVRALILEQRRMRRIARPQVSPEFESANERSGRQVYEPFGVW